MEDANSVYRIRTEVGDNAPNVIHVPLKQSYDMFEILSLKLNQIGSYKTYESNYGVIVGRVTANGGFGVPNAKVSIFIEVSDDDSLKDRLLYDFYSVMGRDANGIRYNLLPDFVDDACHQDVGSFPNKRLVLDNQDIIDMFDKYWKYTTTTNHAGDYMLFGIPTGSQQLHVDVDLSDCGVLSQRPRDMIEKGYNENMFESPNKFKHSTNLNSLTQIISQDRGVYVYPYWGDISDGDENFSLTRCDINLEYKFESYAVFMGSIITDKGSNAIGKNCTATEKNGKMSDLIAGEGKIEMIRKTIDNKVEEFPIKGNRLIDGDGVWCYQIPMNLDYVTTDEFGNLVPTDNPKKGIATRARVRFRITLDEDANDAVARKRASYLVPNNPRIEDELFNDVGPNDEPMPDYEFGTNTNEESYRDLLWNKVYTVKNYIPKLQKNSSETNRKHTGIKQIKYYGDNNPMPYNSLSIKLGFTYRLICVITKIIIKIVQFINQILSLLGAIVGYQILIIKLPGKVLSNLIPNIFPLSKLRKAIRNGWDEAVDFLVSPIKKLVPICIGLDASFCDDGVNKNTYYVGCGTFFGNLFEYSGELNLTKHKTIDKHEDLEKEECKKNKLTADECAETLTNPVVSTAMLYTCVENQLAQENEATSFNFNNDWINGVLYAPLWYRKITPKKRFFFGLFKKRAKDEWCSSQRYSSGLRIIQHCTIDRDKKGNEYKNFNNESVTPYYIDKARCKGKDKKCHEQHTSIRCRMGAIVPKETMLGQTIYYYKPVEYDATLPKNNLLNTTKKGDIKLLFATDIVLLGSLNECDINGVPQFFKSLDITSYKMPTDILFTDYDFKMTVNDDGEIVNANENETTIEVNTTSEMSGCDWGNPNEFGKKDGGLFYSIGCSTIELQTKSCVNLSRICEFGVSLDETKEVADLVEFEKYKKDEDTIINNNDDIYQKLVTDGFVSWDELFNLDERSMFATMNANKLKTIQNNSGLLEYDFRYLYPENFDGSLKSVMEETTKNYPTKINYKNNYKLEEPSRDYYIFRMGNTPYYYDNDRAFPRYENSFYFYFGLKAGKTAIEKFNSKYFAECFNPDTIQNQIGIKTQSNSWCSTTNDGYIAFDFSGISTPYDLLINSTDGVFSFEINEVTEEKIYISNEENQTLEGNGYVRLKINGQRKYDPNGDNVRMFDNGAYTGNVVDGERNISEFQFVLNRTYLSFDVNAQGFEQPNNVLMDTYGNYKAISEHKGDIDTDDTKNILRTDIGGVITLSDIFLGSTELDNYQVELVPESNLGSGNEEYKGVILTFKNGDVNVTEGCGSILYPNLSNCSKDDYNDHIYAFGLPKGKFTYTLTVTQLCGDKKSRNSISKKIFISEPMPYKMYINDIDYDVIKNFTHYTGWDANESTIENHQVTENSNVLNMDNPWFKIENIYYADNIIGGVNNNDITDFFVEKYEGTSSFTVKANLSDGTIENVAISTLVDEFATNKNNQSKVPYNWVDNYIVSGFEGIKWTGIDRTEDEIYTAYDNIDSFIDEVNKVMQNRRELVSSMKNAFYIYCENASHSFSITGRTDKLPYTQTVVYHPEKAVEYEDYNELDGNSLIVENEGDISDIKIPTISYNSNPDYSNGNYNNDEPCIVQVGDNKKKPYYAAIMNNSGISIPKEENGKSFAYNGDNPKYINNSTKLKYLFDFPLIDKILKVDYIAWSAFIGIPQYGYDNDNSPRNGIVTMNGLLAGIIYNGNTVNERFETQTLNDIDLKLSENIADTTRTYIEKRIINGFDYNKLAAWVKQNLITLASAYITQDIVDKINHILEGLHLNLTIDNILNILNDIEVVNGKLKYGNYEVDVQQIISKILNFKNYVTIEDARLGQLQYSFMLPMETEFMLQDENYCQFLETLEGDLKVTLSENSINDCKNDIKILEVESDDSTYYSVFNAGSTGELYPLNSAETNELLWFINERIYGKYLSSTNANMFSFQMKTNDLREGYNNTDFKSQVAVEGEFEEEMYVDTEGYGTTGLFEYEGNDRFNFPVFIVAETDNHVRALSPVYDYSDVKALFKYGVIKSLIPHIVDGQYQDPIQNEQYKIGVAVNKGHFYLDNFKYTLEASVIINSYTSIDIPKQTLYKPKTYIYSDMSASLYELINGNKESDSFFDNIFSQTNVTATDITTLKHVCCFDSSTDNMETTWVVYAWYANLPDGLKPASYDTAGIKIDDRYVDYTDKVYEENDDVETPDMHENPNKMVDKFFMGWSENKPDKENIIDASDMPTKAGNLPKLYYGNWGSIFNVNWFGYGEQESHVNVDDKDIPDNIYNVRFFANDKITLINEYKTYEGYTINQPNLYDNRIWYKINGDNKQTVSFPYTVNEDIDFYLYDLTALATTNHPIILNTGDEEGKPTEMYYWVRSENGINIYKNVMKQSLMSGNYELPIEFDNNTFEHIITEDDKNCDKIMANPIEDNGEGRIYSFRARGLNYLPSSTMCQIRQLSSSQEGEIIAPPSGEDINYVTVSCDWQKINDQNFAGTDLDVVGIVRNSMISKNINGETIVNELQGFKTLEDYPVAGTTVISSSYKNLVKCYLESGRDCWGDGWLTQNNKSNGQECILFNLKNIRENLDEEIEINTLYLDIYANWFSIGKGDLSGKINANIKIWKGNEKPELNGTQTEFIGDEDNIINYKTIEDKQICAVGSNLDGRQVYNESKGKYETIYDYTNQVKEYFTKVATIEYYVDTNEIFIVEENGCGGRSIYSTYSLKGTNESDYEALDTRKKVRINTSSAQLLYGVEREYTVVVNTETYDNEIIFENFTDNISTYNNGIEQIEEIIHDFSDHWPYAYPEMFYKTETSDIGSKFDLVYEIDNIDYHILHIMYNTIGYGLKYKEIHYDDEHIEEKVFYDELPEQLKRGYEKYEYYEAKMSGYDSGLYLRSEYYPTLPPEIQEMYEYNSEQFYKLKSEYYRIDLNTYDALPEYYQIYIYEPTSKIIYRIKNELEISGQNYDLCDYAGENITVVPDAIRRLYSSEQINKIEIINWKEEGDSNGKNEVNWKYNIHSNFNLYDKVLIYRGPGSLYYKLNFIQNNTNE